MQGVSRGLHFCYGPSIWFGLVLGQMPTEPQGLMERINLSCFKNCKELTRKAIRVTSQAMRPRAVLRGAV